MTFHKNKDIEDPTGKVKNVFKKRDQRIRKFCNRKPVLNLKQEMKHTFVATQTSIKKPSQPIGKYDARVAPIDENLEQQHVPHQSAVLLSSDIIPNKN